MDKPKKQPILDEFWVDEERRIKAIRRSGSPNWYVQVNVGGVQRRVSLKTSSKKEARTRASGVATRLLSGELTPGGQRARLTLAAAAEAHLTRLRELGRDGHTLACYERVFAKLAAFLPKGGDTPLTGLTRGVLEAFERKLRSDGLRALPRKGRRKIRRRVKPLSAKTVRDSMKIARGLLRDAVRSGTLAEDPARGYRLPPGPTRKIVTFSAEELAALFADPQPGMADLWRFYTLTCLRAHELLWLLREDVVLDAAGRPVAIHIRAKACPVTGRRWHPKHGKERVVPLGAEAAGILERALATGGSAWAFTSPVASSRGSRRWTYEPLRLRLHRRLKEAGFAPRGLHAFRHTGATFLANDGAMPIAQLKEFLGHQSLVETQRYLHPKADDIAQSLARIDYSRLAPAPGSRAPGSGKETGVQGRAASSGDTQRTAAPGADAPGAESSQNPVNPSTKGAAA